MVSRMELVDKVLTVIGVSLLFLGLFLMAMGIENAFVLTTTGIVVGIVLPDWK